MSDERQPTDGGTPDDSSAGAHAVNCKMVEVFRTSDPALAPVIRSLFAASGIPFEIEGEETMGLFPIGQFIGGGPRRHLDTIFWVPESHAEEAASLLESESEVEIGVEMELETE